MLFLDDQILTNFFDEGSTHKINFIKNLNIRIKNKKATEYFFNMKSSRRYEYTLIIYFLVKVFKLSLLY